MLSWSLSFSVNKPKGGLLTLRRKKTKNVNVIFSFAAPCAYFFKYSENLSTNDPTFALKFTFAQCEQTFNSS